MRTTAVGGLLLGLAILVASCQLQDLLPGPDGQTVRATGTVRFVELEGGFYGILADDGPRYLPLNLEASFQVDGLRVKFEAKLRPEKATIQQWGTPIELLAIERIY